MPRMAAKSNFSSTRMREVRIARCIVSLPPVFLNLRRQRKLRRFHVQHFQFRVTIGAIHNLAHQHIGQYNFGLTLRTQRHDLVPPSVLLRTVNHCSANKNALHPRWDEERHLLSWYHPHSPPSHDGQPRCKDYRNSPYAPANGGEPAQVYSHPQGDFCWQPTGLYSRRGTYGLRSSRPLSACSTNRYSSHHRFCAMKWCSVSQGRGQIKNALHPHKDEEREISMFRATRGTTFIRHRLTADGLTGS